MTPERWKQIDELAQAALERGDDQRAAFLDEACAGDDALRREVESQIAYQQQASKFLEEPAFKHAAELIADAQTESESMEGRTISHYSILRKLGAGGMGEVYLAQDTTLSRKVAIKFLSQNSVVGGQARKRLLREAKAAAALDHPHICAVYEVGEEADHSFIVMQYVEGETLASRIQRQPLNVREALDIAVQIADALAEAHSHRIIHRDVKPQNVMLTASGQVKVLDFGLARVVREGSLIDSIEETESLLTMPGSVIGTVPYMSPEQVRGEALDGRSDIFSFGAVLYEMLSGRNPFAAESVGATMSSILTKEPAPLARYASEVPDELQRIVRKALSKDKEGRYQGIKDLLIDLRELKQELEFEAKFDRSIEPVHTGEPIATRSTSSTGVVIGEIKRHKLGLTLIAAAAVVVAVAAFVYFNRKPVLTDKDTILLADFDNKTGDEVFDGTLKQGLAVQLEQSPFLNLFPDTRVRDTLKLMNRSAEERVTTEIGQEICQRQGLKALIAGSIAPLGSHYVIALEAVNAQTTNVMAREQVEAESKEQVLSALGKAATRLREKLGESLSLIQKFDAPIDGATTLSLEALRAFSLGMEQASRGSFPESITFLKRAIDLDPNFASAYSMLSGMYHNTRQGELAVDCASKAYARRDRVTELEKLVISSLYFSTVLRDSEKTLEILEIWKETYPRDPRAPNQLAGYHGMLGQFEKEASEAREAIRLSPNNVIPLANLIGSLFRLNRFGEARELCERALQKDLDGPDIRFVLLAMGFIDGDTSAVQRQIEWASGKPNEYDAFDWQAQMASFRGQWRQAQGFTRLAIDLATRRDKKGVAATYAAQQALVAAFFGEFAQAKAMAPSGVSLDRASALALALCGESSRVQPFVDDLVKQYPKDTVVNDVWLPAIRAAMELQRGNPARAIELLQPALRYEASARFWPQYVRGQAYLKLNKATEAAAEFQKILDHRGEAALSALYPLAQMGLARAAALAGDATASHKAYQNFFALWKDADADLPILIEAKKEYAGLK